MRLFKLIVVAGVLAACAPASEAPPPQPPTPETPEPAPEASEPDPGPFGVILIIGDGAGLDYWSAARLGFPSLGVEELPVIGLVGTTATDNYITDSAAGATAYSTGTKTYNGAIGVGPDSAEVETVLEVAGRRGKATGIVVTSTITHATPASFVAHVVSRYMHFEIAEQMTEADVDVMIGGGRRYFDPVVRQDSVDLLVRLAREATVTDSVAALRALDLDVTDRLVAFIAEDNPEPASRRDLTLGEMTRTALSILGRDDDGFFLMVEGSQIDWRGHGNAALNAVLSEMHDVDSAVRAALEFQQERPNTLIVVTADHETGGLALHYDQMGVFRAHYTTESHTAGMVPLFAGGPGAESFGGMKENDEIGRILLDLIRDDGPAIAP